MFVTATIATMPNIYPGGAGPRPVNNGGCQQRAFNPSKTSTLWQSQAKPGKTMDVDAPRTRPRRRDGFPAPSFISVPTTMWQVGSNSITLVGI